jgi:hypothetical protein
MPCIRCGNSELIERHHIKHRKDGGSNDDVNLEDRCRHCHKYQHAKEQLLKNIADYAGLLRRLDCNDNHQKRRYYQFVKNIKKNLYRLEVLERENTPGLIRMRGYRPYWEDQTTHWELAIENKERN